MVAGPSAKGTISATQSGRRMPMMASRQDIESARLSMLKVRKVLEDYETLKGVASTGEHMRLTRAFAKATRAYLTLSASTR